MINNPKYKDFFDDKTIEELFKSAPLHDIGKVGVPDGVLLKPTKLSPSEMAMMYTHCTIGRDICMTVKNEMDGQDSSFIDMAAEVTGSHHEQWDGGGYPDGLAGTKIPLSARIVGLADFYDACRSATVYRAEPIPRDNVLALIDKWAGRKFDPLVVEAFRLCDGDVLKIEEAQRRPTVG